MEFEVAKYKKAYTKVISSNGQHVQGNLGVLQDSKLPLENRKVTKLACPLCRVRQQRQNEVYPRYTYIPYNWSKYRKDDSPVGVKFSYSYMETNYDIGDIKTTFDMHVFLLKICAQNASQIIDASLGHCFVNGLKY
ncbi:Serine carboxypeptidase-like 20, partial [Mucuna pruriens]